MDALITAAGVVAIGAITPGPNNLLVMRASAHGGWKAAVSAAGGILIGSLALVFTVVAGASALLEIGPAATRILSVGACLLLGGFGMALIRASFRPGSGPLPTPRERRLRGTGRPGALFLFQFLNPKAWILAVAVVTSLGASSDPLFVLPQLVALFVLIPAVCLALWSLAGLLAMQHLERPPVRAWFDRLTGGVLIGFALLLLIGGLHVG